MPLGNQQERTERATPRRRAQARQEGQVARSREAVSAALFLGVVVFFAFAGPTLSKQLFSYTQATLGALDQAEMTPRHFQLLWTQSVHRVATILAPLMVTLFSLALGANLVQTGFLFSLKAMRPKWSHLSPARGIKRVFSAQAFNELFKSLVKVGVVGYIAYGVIAGAIEPAFALSGQGVAAVSSYLSQTLLQLGVRTSYAIVAMALLDYAFQRWQHEKNIRMTHQEVRDEKKQEEGDPHVKSRIRSIMRELARRRMMEEVPNADVIITNPTHLAVALIYQRDEMQAPKVIAKGAGHIAQRIKTIARENRIPIVENKPVAQHLYRAVEIGGYIPETLYQAVAEILAYVYKIRPRSATSSRAHSVGR